jgi:hypothetical protein
MGSWMLRIGVAEEGGFKLAFGVGMDATRGSDCCRCTRASKDLIWTSKAAISALSARARSEIGSGFFLNQAMGAEDSMPQQHCQEHSQAGEAEQGYDGKGRRSCGCRMAVAN